MGGLFTNLDCTNRLQQLSTHPFQVPGLTLPDHKDLPAIADEPAPGQAITPHITVKLCAPEFQARFRGVRVLTARVSVPEATVDEYCNTT
jgi:hypothetical protein